jgi:Pvc16 N-terminal domain
MAWSVDDLSIITELLITELRMAIQNSAIYLSQHFAFEVSGVSPEVSRTEGKNVLTLYLLHVSRDPYWRNTPVSGNRAQLVTSQPLSLNLSYLMTSYADDNWMLEQQLMSIALSCFHANPIFKTATAEFTVSVEADSIEEMSRLWQAITAPIRLSAMFRVAIVFLAPPLAPVTDSRAPVEVNISVAPDLNSPVPPPLPPVEPILLGLGSQYVWNVPPPVLAEAAAALGSLDDEIAQVGMTAVPTVAVAGGNVWIRGIGLDVADASAVFLSQSGIPGEWQLLPLPSPLPNPPWIGSGDLASGTSTAANDLHLILPTTYGPLPGVGQSLTVTPMPGIYQITVGNPSTLHRSNALQLAIGPIVTGIGNGAPVLAADGTGTYTINVSGLIAGQTSLLLDTTALTIAAAPAAGVAAVDIAAGTIAWMFASPPGFASGTYVNVRVIVNGVEAPPGWWVLIP